MGVRVARVCALLSLTSIGCARVDQIVSPAPAIDVLDRSSVEIALRSPRAEVQVPSPTRDIGCALTQTREGRAPRAAVISRNAVSGLLGRIDYVSAPVVRGRPTRGALHVVSADFSVSGSLVTVNCLVKFDVSHEDFALLLARSRHDRVWHAAIERAEPVTDAESTQPGVLASRLLLAPVAGALSRRTQDPQVLAGRLRPARGPKLNTAGCGFDTGIECGIPTLPTVNIYGPMSGPGIADYSELYRTRRMYSLSDLAGLHWMTYQGPDCAAESESYNAAVVASEEAIEQLEYTASQMEAAMAEVAGLVCEPEWTAGGKDLCIDLFIMSERAAFFVGDRDDFDRHAPWSASRAQLYIDPATCTVEKHVNTTRTVGIGPINPGTHRPHHLNRAVASRNAAGQCVVEWSLLNGWCKGPMLELVCPSIDGRLVLEAIPGGYQGNVNADKFPAMGIYWWTGGVWNTISEREQGHMFDLTGWRRHKDKIRLMRPEYRASEGCTAM